VTAINLLRLRLEKVSQAKVAEELGISRAAVSQILSGKYGASPERIETRILTMYGGREGMFTCPHRNDSITPSDCAELYNRAKSAGTRVPGNPETLRQYHACKKCEIRR